MTKKDAYSRRGAGSISYESVEDGDLKVIFPHFG